jgi:succinate dehydrogenase / fumarate reductase cytochrome b subunit
MRIPERTSEPLRRIHSLTGMIPLGVFLVEHLAVNSTALAGPEMFRAVAAGLGGVPGRLWLEILGIGLPLLVHMTIGVLIAAEIPEEGNQDARGWSAWSQRLTGIYLMIYVAFHVWGTRLSPEVVRDRQDLFVVMHAQVRDPGGFAFHALGVLSAAWHLGHGLPRFAARWWPRAAPGALRAAAGVGYSLAAALAIVGIATLAAFARSAP